MQTSTGPTATACSSLCSVSIPSSVWLLATSIFLQILFVIFEAAAYMYRCAKAVEVRDQLALETDLTSFKSA